LGPSAIQSIATHSLDDIGASGFQLLPVASNAYATRIELVAQAQRSLDVQYYLVGNDDVGHGFLRALRDAAMRGVRVRLLVDDLYTTGEDPILSLLNKHPNVEVRLFNPFTAGRSSTLSRFLLELNRVSELDHRMHNKMFIADGAMAVFGGRNVANEYFLRNDMAQNFIDVDAFTVGFIVAPMQALFDRYWNSDPVYPLGALAKTRLSKEELRAKFEEWTGPENTPPPAPLPPNDVLGYGPISDDLDGGRLGLIWGDAYVFADYPDKPFEPGNGEELLETSATYNAVEAIRMAKTEVVATSPYLVPGQRGMVMLRSLRERNVKVTLMTNSLGSTDEPIVHLGYSHYREEMLKIGIDLYEISSLRVKKNKRNYLFGSSLGRLHAKLVVIDRKTSFIGSMNLDPRSATTNTEFGAVIDSPELARELIRVIDIDRLQSAYRVRLGPGGGGLQWLSIEDDEEMVQTTEPESSPWLRLKLWLLTHLVPEHLL